METVASTTQDACGKRDVCSPCSTPWSDVVSRKNQRKNYLMEHILNTCMWLSREQRLKIQEQYLNKNLTKVNTIVGEVWDSLSPFEQMIYETQAFRLEQCHAIEFPGYKLCLKIKSRECFCSECYMGTQHIGPTKYPSTCKSHKKFNTNSEVEMIEPRPPMLVLQTVERSTGDTVVEVVATPAPTTRVDDTPSDVNTDIPSSVEGSNQSPTSLLASKKFYSLYDSLVRAMDSDIYHKLMVSKSQDLVAKMQGKMPQLSVPLEEYQYDEIERAMNSKIYHDLTVSKNLDMLAEKQEKMPQLQVPLEQPSSS